MLSRPSRTSYVPLNVAEPETEPDPDQDPDTDQESRTSPMPGSSPRAAKSRSRSGAGGRAQSSLPKSRDSGAGNSAVRIPVPTRHRDNAQRTETQYRRGALRRLGIKDQDTRHLPAITRLLEHADGGIATVIAALRLCEDQSAVDFLARYDKVSATDRAYVTVEEIALAAGVGAKRLLELAVSALVEDSESMGKIIAAAYHPRVIRATAECAILFPENQSDRKLFLTSTGFVPQPANRTGGVFIKNEVNIPIPGANPDQLDDGPVFNAAEDDLQRLHSTLDGAKMLEAPRTVVDSASITIGHQYKDEQDLSCIPVPKR